MLENHHVLLQQHATARGGTGAENIPSFQEDGVGTRLALSNGTPCRRRMTMPAHAAARETPPLHLVHSRPTSWIATATLADTRAYLEDMLEAWQALAVLSVPQHIPAPVAEPQFRQISIVSQAFPSAVHRCRSVGGAGLEIA
jgi:hypothetical protein